MNGPAVAVLAQTLDKAKIWSAYLKVVPLGYFTPVLGHRFGVLFLVDKPASRDELEWFRCSIMCRMVEGGYFVIDGECLSPELVLGELEKELSAVPVICGICSRRDSHSEMCPMGDPAPPATTVCPKCGAFVVDVFNCSACGDENDSTWK